MPGQFVTAALVSFLVNFTTFLAIRQVGRGGCSALCCAVPACLARALPGGRSTEHSPPLRAPPPTQASATSVKVAGCLKNVAVVWGGILQGDVVTFRELQASQRWRAARMRGACIWLGCLHVPAPHTAATTSRCRPLHSCTCPAGLRHLPHRVCALFCGAQPPGGPRRRQSGAPQGVTRRRASRRLPVPALTLAALI